MSSIQRPAPASPMWLKDLDKTAYDKLLNGDRDIDFWAEHLSWLPPMDFLAGLMNPHLRGLYIATLDIAGPICGYADKKEPGVQQTQALHNKPGADEWMKQVDASIAEADRLGVSWQPSFAPMPPISLLDEEIRLAMAKHAHQHAMRTAIVEPPRYVEHKNSGWYPGCTRGFEDFAHLTFVREYGGQGVAMNWSGDNLVIRTLPKLKTSYPDKVVQWRDEKGELKTRNAIDALKEHPKTWQYESADFLPGRETPKGVFNMWKGWKYKPEPDDDSGEPVACTLFLDHLYDVACGGNSEYYEYLLLWIADAFQNPHRTGQVALVLVGPQGSGKDFIAEAIGGLFAPHALTLDKADQLTGHFTSHLQKASWVTVTEGFFANMKLADILKATITTENMFYIPKGLDGFMGRKTFRLCITSNRINSLHIEDGDRRYFVLEVDGNRNGQKRNKNPEYHVPLRKEWANGGDRAFFNWMMGDYWKRRLENENVFARPTTKTLEAQRLESLAPEQRVVMNMLLNGDAPCEVNWGRWDQMSGGYVKNQAVFVPTLEFAKAAGMQGENHAPVAEVLKAVGGQRSRTILAMSRRQAAGFWLPGLDEARTKWAEYLGQDIDWSEGAEDWAGDGATANEKAPF